MMTSGWHLLEACRQEVFAPDQHTQGPAQAESSLRQLLKDFSSPTAVPETALRHAAEDLMGLALWHQGRYSQAAEHYYKCKQAFLAGYCWLLAGQLEKTRQCWSIVAKERPNHWCVSLFGLIHRQPSVMPSVLQVRNYLEADIGHLLKARQHGFVQNILAFDQFLAQVNLEAYKYIGRAFLHAGQLEGAAAYFAKSQQLIPTDPETYFHWAQCLLAQQAPDATQVRQARRMLQQCLMINPTYTPAQWLLGEC